MTLIKKEYNGTWVRGKPKFTTKSSPINVDRVAQPSEPSKEVEKRSKLTKENQQKLKKLVGGGFQTIA